MTAPLATRNMNEVNKQREDAMPARKMRTIQPTPLRGKLKIEDIRKAVQEVREERLKREAEERKARRGSR